MNTIRNLAVLLTLTGAVLCASLFVCAEVHSYEEMADIRIGLPIPFLSVNKQRFTPQTFPQCFAVGSPWEDPMRVHWASLLGSFLLVFGAIIGVVMAAGAAHRGAVLYLMRWLALPVTVTAAFFGAGIAGVLIAVYAGLWEEAVAGFLCAGVVVLAAYLLAPKYKLAAATGALLSGAVIAWHLVSPPSPRPQYNAATGITTGVPTYQSIAATYAGGALSWAVCLLLARKDARGA